MVFVEVVQGGGGGFEEGGRGGNGNEVPLGQDVPGSHFEWLHSDPLSLSLVQGPAISRGSGQRKLPAATAQQRCLVASCSYRLPTKVSLIVRHSPGAGRRKGALSPFFAFNDIQFYPVISALFLEAGEGEGRGKGEKENTEVMRSRAGADTKTRDRETEI